MRRIVLSGPPSLSSRILWWIIKLRTTLFHSPAPVPPKGPQKWELPPPRLAKQIAAGTVQVDEWKVDVEGTEWTIPVLRTLFGSMPDSSDVTSPPPRAKRAMLYFHGGSFTRGLGAAHWTWMKWLSEELDADVHPVPYPLAPTNTGSEAMAALVEVYRAFSSRCDGQEIILAGESAGGVIALGLAYGAHQAKLPLPHQIIAISPGVNLVIDKPDDEISAFQKLDPMLTVAETKRGRRMWAGLDPDSTDPIPSTVLSDPRVNPIAGDPAIFAEAGTKVIVTSGTYDVLHPYVYDFVQKLEGCEGVKAVYVEGPGQVHVFPMVSLMMPGYREGVEACRAIVESVLAFSPT